MGPIGAKNHFVRPLVPNTSNLKSTDFEPYLAPIDIYLIILSVASFFFVYAVLARKEGT